MKTSTTRQLLIVIGSLLVISASVGWIFFRGRTSNAVNLKLHQGLGEVMAERTIRLLEKKDKKRIVIVATDQDDPALEAQLNAFQKTIEKAGDIEVKERIMVEPDGKRRYEPGLGMSARRYVRIAKNNLKADCIVSFIGVPDPDDEEMKQLDIKPPRMIAETKELEKLPKLFKERIIRVAIVPRYQFPAPGSAKPRTAREWFDRYFQVVTTNRVSTLPID